MARAQSRNQRSSRSLFFCPSHFALSRVPVAGLSAALGLPQPYRVSLSHTCRVTSLTCHKPSVTNDHQSVVFPLAFSEIAPSLRPEPGPVLFFRTTSYFPRLGPSSNFILYLPPSATTGQPHLSIVCLRSAVPTSCTSPGAQHTSRLRLG